MRSAPIRSGKRGNGAPPERNGAIKILSSAPGQAVPWTRLTSGGSSGESARPPGSGALDATGAASFVCVADVQFGGACGGDRADSGALELEDDRGGLQARTTAGSDGRRRSHGQAFQAPRVLTFAGESASDQRTVVAHPVARRGGCIGALQ